MSQIQVPYARFEQSGRIGARVDLLDVRLQSLTTQLEDFSAAPPFVVDLDVDTSVQRGEEHPVFSVSAEYTLRALAFGDEQDPEDAEVTPELTAARVSFTLIALYGMRDDAGHCDPPLDEDEFKAFAETTGLLALHAYARELIQDQTSRIGLPPLTMGVAQIVR